MYTQNRSSVNKIHKQNQKHIQKVPLVFMSMVHDTIEGGKEDLKPSSINNASMDLKEKQTLQNEEKKIDDEIKKKKKKDKKKKNKKKKEKQLQLLLQQEQQQQQQQQQQDQYTPQNESKKQDKELDVEEEKESNQQDGITGLDSMMDTDWSKLFEDTEMEECGKEEQQELKKLIQHHDQSSEYLNYGILTNDNHKNVTAVMMMGEQHRHQEDEGNLLKLIGINLIYTPSNALELLPAYWDTELPKASICGEFQPYNTMIHECEPMKVLARSRDGQFIACTALSSIQKQQQAQKKKMMKKKQRKNKGSKLVILQLISTTGWTVIHEISNFQYTETASSSSAFVMITDSIQKVTIQANVTYQNPQSIISTTSTVFEEEDDGSLECFKDLNQEEEEDEEKDKEKTSISSKTKQDQDQAPIVIAVSIPPATLLIQVSDEEVMCVTLSNYDQSTSTIQPRPHDEGIKMKTMETILLNGIEAKAVNSFIQTYSTERRQALANAFWKFQEVTNCPNQMEYCCDSFNAYGDFTLAYTSSGCTSNSQKFPSLFTLTKNIGRPSFSADKGPRLNKSPSLSDDEEMEGIFTLFTILRHMRNFVDHWSITQQTQALFSRSMFYGQLISKRTEMVAVVWQLRRWLPLCKLLGKRERNIIRSLNPNKMHWMQTRGAELRIRIRKWIKNGEPSLPIVGHTPYETMHEWVDVWLNKMAEDPTFSFNGAKMDGKHRFSSCYTDDIRNEDLKSMDETRKQMLSQIMTSVSREEELPFIEGKAKKIQKGFQQLAQNLSGHERNFKALLIMLSKVDSIIRRIDCVEKDVKKTISDMTKQLIQKEEEEEEDKKEMQEELKDNEEGEEKDPQYILSEEEVENQQKLFQMHQMIKLRMKSIEQHYGVQIQEAMQPSKQVLGEKRKLSETQDFLSTLSDFISQEENTGSISSA